MSAAELQAELAALERERKELLQAQQRPGGRVQVPRAPPPPLLSVVVPPPTADVGGRAEPAKRPVAPTNEHSRKRNARLFGSLMGTLAAFKEGERAREDREALRAAALLRAEQKSAEESQRLLQLEREGQGERRRVVTQQSAELTERVERKRKQLAHARWCERKEREAGFLLTAALPALLWKPARLCEATRAALAVRQAECTAAIQGDAELVSTGPFSLLGADLTLGILNLVTDTRARLRLVSEVCKGWR